MKDEGTTIEVNHANVTTEIYNQTANYDMTEFFNQTTTVDYYWEKSTGLLLGFTEYTVTERENVTETVSYMYQKVGLEQTFYPLIDSTDYPVNVDSDSAILGFAFNETENKISISVLGTTETSGFCDFVVPIDLLSGNLSILLDDSFLVEGSDYARTSNSSHNMFEVPFSGEGVHTIELVNSNDIPEFPNLILLATLTVAIMLAVITYRKKLNHKS
jgi:hypothetical protein